jgi:hypothetical protein
MNERMRDHNDHILHEGELVFVLHHPEVFISDSWMVLDFLGCTKDFVLQHYISNEIRIFNQRDVERMY